nr:mitochondrial import inner membrane translocase subunit TIM22-like [Tanacetum cinerariifolium]
MKVIQAHDATSNELSIPSPLAPIAPTTVLPPPPVLPPSPLFDLLKPPQALIQCMIAGIGAGVLVSLLRGSGLTNAIAFGVAHGLMNGGITKVKEKFSQPRIEDELFKKTSVMLSNLGLGHYEENFKKEFLTDETLPLLSDSTLKEAKIPVGARVLIIDHIQKEEKAKKRCWR